MNEGRGGGALRLLFNQPSLETRQGKIKFVSPNSGSSRAPVTPDQSAGCSKMGFFPSPSLTVPNCPHLTFLVVVFSTSFVRRDGQPVE